VGACVSVAGVRSGRVFAHAKRVISDGPDMETALGGPSGRFFRAQRLSARGAALVCAARRVILWIHKHSLR
jgi:hypothetical protein